MLVNDRRMTVSGAFTLATLLVVASPARAGKFYNFADGPGHSGSLPSGPLTPVFDKLCGVTYQGGASYGGDGTFYCLTRQADDTFQETTDLSFDVGDNRGSKPFGRLAVGAENTVYGVTSGGGGTVYQVKLPGRGGASPLLKTIYKFGDGDDDGHDPAGGVVIGADGSLYGATLKGGSADDGVVYRLTPPAAGGSAWTETNIYEFTDRGTLPVGGLAMDATGTLYGATMGGPAPNLGTVYALTPPQAGSSAWGFAILHNFGITADDGKNPNGDLLVGPGGVLYGTCKSAKAGPGNVYSLAPPSAGQTGWQYTELYLFGQSSPADGTDPRGGLLLDSAGNLYGTTYPGARVELGAVAFRLAPGGAQNGWTETILQRFSPKYHNGLNPSELTYGAKGNLLGITGGGGVNNAGTAFRIRIQ